ncbi:GSCFA domain-containing protein [Rhodobacter sp. NTK016B]|uniref:GSCFA domain-containing protein n=1 Tax=Rhodobacter sp. NTK016B TaxID=2759676 RepID=UPI001A8F7F9D|nr:GSCFA domain-containing protein [Rhodobacter sp. NTK016B]MBN8292593.1 GSCFA domain-containing protein [Rhodobacter sp. NTK016B]
MTNPYSDLPKRAFWRSGVADHSPLAWPDIYRPRFDIDRKMRITCAGSCFAQHIGAQFKRRGYNFVDLEPAPPMLARENWHKFGFDLYSARYGNIYTARQLVQMLARGDGSLEPSETAWIDPDGRARDPFRPAIEPDGFSDAAELARDREWHLQQVATLLDNTDLFVFTLGLTEAWECVADDVVLPTCPGTVGGTFDAAKYRFKNFSFLETLTDMNRFIEIARARNPAMKFLFTVSPVPLTATASDQHVLVATMQSKSILRAVAAELYDSHDCVDYFPSYELVAAHPMRAMSYMPNLRNVASEGVARVMDVFFGSIGGEEPMAEAESPTMPARPAPRAAAQDDDLVCEEALLEAFGQ